MCINGNVKQPSYGIFVAVSSLIYAPALWLPLKLVMH